MALDIMGVQGSLFKHSSEYDQGLSTRKVRPGQTMILVAKDGSGDFDSIQEAVNALPSSGGVIYIKEGTYKIYSGVVIAKNNVLLQGHGMGTIITIGSPWVGAEYMINCANVSGIQVEKLYFHDGNVGVRFDTVTKSSVRDCTFDTMTGYGVRLYCGDRNNVDGNKCVSCDIGINAQQETNSIITNNTIENSSYNGIRVHSAGHNNIIIGNMISGCGEDGIKLGHPTGSQADRCIVIGNQCLSNTGNGILVENNSCDNNILVGNVVVGNTAGQIVDAGTGTVNEHNVVA
jgi:parallel beta-helix repeat protein